jgi:methylmalonyl-CoA mutase C-terminal domain/subunit
MKKVLISKIGLDGHEVGARIIVNLLLDNGFKVEYLGIRQTIDDILAKAESFRPDAIGISIMTGAHNFFIPKLRKALDTKKLKSIKLICGGLIPQKDIKPLMKYADAVFDNNSKLDDILKYFKECI